ncbi:MAG: Pvc16 family protein [Caldilineaceae bacterium]
MIHLLDQSLRRLLVYELNIDEEQVSFQQPVGEWMKDLSSSKPVINLYLYDVRENAPLRRQQWEQMVNGHNGDSRQNKASLRRSPLLIDCFYVVSAWSQADQRSRPTMEHSLLSRCLLALARHPILNPKTTDAGDLAVTPGRSIMPADRQRQIDFLEEALLDQDIEIRTRLANHDVLTNPAEVWSAMENQMKAAFSYVVTLPMNPWQDLTQEAGEVGSATFVSPPPQGPTTEDGLPHVKPNADAPRSPSLIGGLVQRVRTKVVQRPDGTEREVEESIPQPELDVWVVEKGVRVVTDQNGRFVFRRIPPGDYTIAVYASQQPRPTKEEDVILPANRKDKPLQTVTHQVPAGAGETRTIVITLD